MKKKIVTVIGTGHCGSTLLDLILGSHSKIFSLGEFHTIYRTVERCTEDAPKVCVVCSGPCDFWNKKASFSILNLYFSRKSKIRAAIGKFARHIYSPYNFIFQWSGKSVLVDSSKQPNWFKSQLSSASPANNIDQYLIYITRDGRAVVNSYLRKRPELGIDAISQSWKKQVVKSNEYYDKFPENRKIKIHI